MSSLMIAPTHLAPDVVFWDVFRAGTWTLHLVATDWGLCQITLPGEKMDGDERWFRRFMPDVTWRHDRGVLEPYACQLDEYFRRQRQDFSGTLDVYGTSFQTAVWKALINIPYGYTQSYQQVAITVGNPRALRAVGGANNANHIPIIIPCHRVIGKYGDLVGYGGGMKIKQALLALEKGKPFITK